MDLSSTPAGTLASRWQWLLIALIVGWLIWLLAPVLTPFVCAALLGWLGDPWVDRLERSGRSRTTAVVLVFTLMTLLLVLALVLWCRRSSGRSSRWSNLCRPTATGSWKRRCPGWNNAPGWNWWRGSTRID